MSYYVDFIACFFADTFQPSSSDISNWFEWLRTSDSREIYISSWLGKFAVNQDQEYEVIYDVMESTQRLNVISTPKAPYPDVYIHLIP